MASWQHQRHRFAAPDKPIGLDFYPNFFYIYNLPVGCSDVEVDTFALHSSILIDNHLCMLTAVLAMPLSHGRNERILEESSTLQPPNDSVIVYVPDGDGDGAKSP